MRRPTEIVQLLDSDEQIELAMNKWLKILSEHIRVDTADIFQLHSDTDTMNVVCEWRAPGQISYFDKINGVEVYSFLHAEKPLVVSTDSLGNAGSKEIEEIGMKAVMIFPILKQESGNMVLSLNHRTQGHVWSMAEIKFTADAVKDPAEHSHQKDPEEFPGRFLRSIGGDSGQRGLCHLCDRPDHRTDAVCQSDPEKYLC